MSIQDKIKVGTYYTRSINLERDADSLEVIKAYIPTSRALRTFSQVANTFNKGQAPRAWSLVGPYGSGKSSFSVFLSQLLSNQTGQSTKAAQQILEKADKGLGASFIEEVDNKEGYLKILITGAPEPMGKRIIKGLYTAALAYWSKRAGKNPAIVALLEKATNTDEYSVSEILNLFKQLQVALEKTGCAGILLIVDELGKFLEYEARHYGANDIFLLQALAEHACEGNEVNLLLFVLLHQSFEQYAKGLGENLKNEWSKVQGRFEEIPFLESAEQVLRVVAAAFTDNFTSTEKRTIRKSVDDPLTVLTKNDALPGIMKKQDALTLFTDCYPLHPVSAILLPLLCQKIAQNERTLFSYLGSYEDFGLQSMLGKFSAVGEFIYPHHIYDYFITNQASVMSDHITNRRWAEVITAIERLGDANENEVNLLKTIGLLNIIGSKGGFKASKAILEKCTVTKSSYTKTIKSLVDKSIINFRRFNSEYRVWQGSDFDLEEALQEEKNNLGKFSVVTALNDSENMAPIVARKYTIQSGTLRYFVPMFVDAKTYRDIKKECEKPRIIFYLAAGKDDKKIFNEQVIQYFSELDIVVLCMNGSQLREAVLEAVSLKRIETSQPILNEDTIAKREFQDRLTSAELSLDRILADLLDCPAENSWFNEVIGSTVLSKRTLQKSLSSVLEGVYKKAPIINNELINRDKLSAQGNGARIKLLLAMLNNETKEDLAIDKFPAEKAIYRALLFETKLHRKDDKSDSWKFAKPAFTKQKDKYNIRHVWRCIDKFLASTEKKPKEIIELNKKLMAPPYGVKAEVLPILYIAAYLCYQHELAIYDNRSYRPYFTEEMLKRFIKRPDEFTFQRFRVEGLRASIFKQYSNAIKDSEVETNAEMNTKNILDLARPLATLMGRLPEYTQKTRQLTNNAIKVRTAFNLAKSPQSLLFNELPEALGFKGLVAEKDDKNLEGFTLSLTESLTELRNAHDKLLEIQKQLLADAFNITMDEEVRLKELREILTDRCSGLENYTIDTKGHRAFIMRLNKETGSDKDWLESLLMFLGHKPSNKWLDNDQETAEYRLMTFSRNVIDLERLKKLQEHVGKKNKDGIRKIKAEIKDFLYGFSDEKLLVWEALAEVIDEYLKADAKVEHISSKDDIPSLVNKKK